jgi:hypothetical protein
LRDARAASLLLRAYQRSSFLLEKTAHHAFRFSLATAEIVCVGSIPRDFNRITPALHEHPSHMLKGREATVNMKETPVKCGKEEMRVLCYHYR